MQHDSTPKQPTKTKRPKKDKKKKEKKALSFRRVISNNLYALRIVHRAAPIYLPTWFLWSVGNGILQFLSNAWLLREVVNRYQEGRPLPELLGLLLAVAVSYYIWNSAVTALSLLIYPRARQRITEQVERTLFQKAAEVELACYESPEFYDRYVKALNSANERIHQVVDTVDSLVWRITTIATTSALIFFIDPIFILFALIPLLSGLIRNRRNRIMKERTDKWRALDRFESYAQRTFYLNEYAKEMRLSDMPKLLFGQYVDMLGKYIALVKEYGPRIAVLQLFTNLGPDLTAFFATLYAAFATLVRHTMLLGDCLVVFQSINNVAWNLTALVGVFAEFRDHALYMEDYRFFMEYEPKLKKRLEGPKAGRGVLAVHDVTFTYTGANQPALRHISLDIRPGEKIALVGQNGSGKTTLVKLLLRLYEPDSGSITLNGLPIGDYESDSYRDAMTTVFQDFKIFSLSVAENVLLRPLEEGDEALVTEALQKSGAYDKVMSLKNGVRTTLTREFDDEGAVLSVGEAQKVTLARAFTNDSPFVILDEPSSALDPIAEYQMFQNMMEACRDRTLIFISHRLSSAVLADRIFLMDNGEITESGTHAELLAKNGKYAEMFRMQAENYADERKEGVQ